MFNFNTDTIWHSDELEAFMGDRRDIENAVIIISEPELSDVGFVRTKYGDMKLLHSGLIPQGSVYLMWTTSNNAEKPLT